MRRFTGRSRRRRRGGLLQSEEGLLGRDAIDGESGNRVDEVGRTLKVPADVAAIGAEVTPHDLGRAQTDERELADSEARREKSGAGGGSHGRMAGEVTLTRGGRG